MNVSFEFWPGCSNELLVEVDFAKWAILLISTPNKDAIAVEVVADIARQRNDWLAGLKFFNAKGALTMRRELLLVIGTLIKLQDAHLQASCSLFLPFLLRESLTLPSFADLSLCVEPGKTLISYLLLFPLLLLQLYLLEHFDSRALLLGSFSLFEPFFFCLLASLSFLDFFVGTLELVKQLIQPFIGL